jgi:hypothetical protein
MSAAPSAPPSSIFSGSRLCAAVTLLLLLLLLLLAATSTSPPPLAPSFRVDSPTLPPPPPPPPPPRPRLGIVVQGPLYTFALPSFTAASLAPVSADEPPPILILSAPESARGSPGVRAYEDAGFAAVFYGAADGAPPRGAWPAKNPNFQRASVEAGVRAAVSRGATHILKMRGDFAFRDLRGFRATFGFPDTLRPLWWFRALPSAPTMTDPVYGPRPNVDTPSDNVLLGPAADVLAMFAGRQDGPAFDSRWPELALLDTWAARRGVSRRDACFLMPKLAPALQRGAVVWNYHEGGQLIDAVADMPQALDAPQCAAECDALRCPPYADVAAFPSQSEQLPPAQ